MSNTINFDGFSVRDEETNELFTPYDVAKRSFPDWEWLSVVAHGFALDWEGFLWITTKNDSIYRIPKEGNLLPLAVLQRELTPVEAIEKLERLQEPEPWEPQIDSEMFEALEMGIEALKKQVGTDTNVGTKARTTKEIIENLKLMQSQVEWDYPMDYAAAIDEAIEAVYVRDEVRSLCRESDNFTLSRSALLWVLGRAKERANPKRYWIIFGDYHKSPVCGKCFKDAYDFDNYDAYCRHCGAKMEGIRKE